MLTLTILGLGLFAGLTIFLSLPTARMRSVPKRARTFLGSLTAGILLFLFWDVTTQALEPVSLAAYAGNAAGTAGQVLLVLGGFLLAFGGLTLFERLYRARAAPNPGPSAPGPEAAAPPPLPPKRAMELIATGIGLHNFAEGLAIGAAYVSGGLSFATVLFVGFALHNSTEGFGVVGPALASGFVPSWGRLVALGLVAGGPTFLGTVVGSIADVPALSTAFLAVAAGAILYVVLELVTAAARGGRAGTRMWGIFAGFALGILTDLLVTAGHV